MITNVIRVAGIHMGRLRAHRLPIETPVSALFCTVKLDSWHAGSRDERVGLMSEVLGPIRMVKFMGWERKIEGWMLRMRKGS